MFQWYQRYQRQQRQTASGQGPLPSVLEVATTGTQTAELTVVEMELAAGKGSLPYLYMAFCLGLAVAMALPEKLYPSY